MNLQYIRGFPTSHFRTVLYDYAYRLGRPFALRGHEDIEHLTGGQGRGVSTSLAFCRERPKFILFFCVKNVFSQTHMMTTESVIKTLDPVTVWHLSRPLYMISPPQSHKEQREQWTPLHTPPTGSFVVPDVSLNMTFFNLMAYHAYQRLVLSTLLLKPLSVCLEPGDLLIVNNEKVLLRHDEPVLPYDKDRLIYRMYVI